MCGNIDGVWLNDSVVEVDVEDDDEEEWVDGFASHFTSLSIFRLFSPRFTACSTDLSFAFSFPSVSLFLSLFLFPIIYQTN